jgi:hypothetical protein
MRITLQTDLIEQEKKEYNYSKRGVEEQHDERKFLYNHHHHRESFSHC